MIDQLFIRLFFVYSTWLRFTRDYFGGNCHLQQFCFSLIKTNFKININGHDRQSMNDTSNYRSEEPLSIVLIVISRHSHQLIETINSCSEKKNACSIDHDQSTQPNLSEKHASNITQSNLSEKHPSNVIPFSVIS